MHAGETEAQLQWHIGSPGVWRFNRATWMRARHLLVFRRKVHPDPTY
jgi:hypothetical protein